MSALIFCFYAKDHGGQDLNRFSHFYGHFALLWLCPYHNAELFVPILVRGDCAIFYRHFMTCFHGSFFHFVLNQLNCFYLQLLLQDSIWDQL